jgi:hypothetical protein
MVKIVVTGHRLVHRVGSGVGVGVGVGVGWHTAGLPEQMSGISAQQGGSFWRPQRSPSTPHTVGGGVAVGIAVGVAVGGVGVVPARTGLVSPRNATKETSVQSVIGNRNIISPSSESKHREGAFE